MSADKADNVTEKAFKTLFKRLASIAIEAGLTAPVAHRLMKEALVETAEGSFTLEGKRLTDSRISVLTGVHRKDIRTFRDGNAAALAAEGSSKPSILSTVIGRWLADPAYSAIEGTHRSLPRQSDEGPSFDALVGTVTSDVRPRTLLDELVRKGAATFDKKTDTVTLTDTALLGGTSLEDGLYFLERNVGDHIATVAKNMLAEASVTPMVERAVFYNRLSADDVDALHRLSREKGIELLQEVNRVALEMQTESHNSPAADERFRFGIYFYREKTNMTDEGPET